MKLDLDDLAYAILMAGFDSLALNLTKLIKSHERADLPHLANEARRARREALAVQQTVQAQYLAQEGGAAAPPPVKPAKGA